MHLLYAVDLGIERVDGSEYGRVLAHLASWLNAGDQDDVVLQDLASSGETCMESSHNQGRHASWVVESTNDGRGINLEVVQRIEDAANLRTRITLTELSGNLTFRAGISRETLERGPLTPLKLPVVYQPGIVRSIAHDSHLSLSVNGQPVDDRYLPFGHRYSAEQLARFLDSKRRLPVLLVHTRDQSAWDVARSSSRKLVGLLRVITVSSAVRNALALLRPHLTIPFGGARLVWSNPEAPGLTWQAADLASMSDEDFRELLMKTLAPVSALYRGEDLAWKALHRAVQADTRRHLVEQAKQAQDISSKDEVIRNLQAQYDELSKNLEDAEQEVQYFSKEYDRVKDAAERTLAAEEQAEYWRKQYETCRSSTGEEESTDPWDEIPALQAHTDPSTTFRALEAVSSKRLVFTDQAAKSWSKIDYPEPEDMFAKLKSLAEAAVDLYSGDAEFKGHVDNWFRDEHNLVVALTDKTLQNKKLKNVRQFEYDGETFEQVPHVKVKDNVKPNAVGRIHFALDSNKKRIIVNHVALKLYDNGK